MTDRTLTAYMHRAGIRSRRELSAITGIAHSTLDDIFKHPARARGYQLAAIAQACGMSDQETVGLITRR
jgi:lambda repressor-like predicted transcriptional regulator